MQVWIASNRMYKLNTENSVSLKKDAHELNTKCRQTGNGIHLKEVDYTKSHVQVNALSWHNDYSVYICQLFFHFFTNELIALFSY